MLSDLRRKALIVFLTNEPAPQLPTLITETVGNISPNADGFRCIPFMRVVARFNRLSLKPTRIDEHSRQTRLIERDVDSHRLTLLIRYCYISPVVLSN